MMLKIQQSSFRIKSAISCVAVSEIQYVLCQFARKTYFGRKQKENFSNGKCDIIRSHHRVSLSSDLRGVQIFMTHVTFKVSGWT